MNKPFITFTEALCYSFSFHSHNGQLAMSAGTQLSPDLLYIYRIIVKQ